MFIETPPPPRVKQISLQGWMTCLNVNLCQFLTSFCKEGKRSHRSCSIILFCRFHCSLKSVENSCQTEKKVLSETSFSPDFGLTEKDTVRSKKLRRENKRSSEWRVDDVRGSETCSHGHIWKVPTLLVVEYTFSAPLSHLKHKPVMA